MPREPESISGFVNQLVPDREVVVTAQAEGYTPASRKITLPEGKTEEVSLILEPK